ncbi:MAG: CBS domain-containing protein [Candidatus Paceibacteria bacterium]|jgi:CBS domain-containing protein
MLVRHFMSRSVTMLEADMTCADAWTQFCEEGLRRAPVVHDKQVIGMVTDRDLLRILPWNLRQLDSDRDDRDLERPLRSILARDLVSVAPNDHLETAAELMLKHKIGGLPVLDGDQVAGIITESDLFRTFVQLKAGAKGTRLTMHWPADGGPPLDPTRVALATGVQLHEYFAFPSPGEGLAIGLRVVGDGLEAFLDRLLAGGYLLLDREDPVKRSSA